MFRRAFQLLPAALLALALSGCSAGDNTHRIWSQAGSAVPTLPPQPQQFPNLPQTRYMREDSLCSVVPELMYAGNGHHDRELVIRVKSRYTTVQYAAYQAFLRYAKDDDHYSELDLEHPRFEYSAHTCLEIDQVRWVFDEVLKDKHEEYTYSRDPWTSQANIISPPEQSIPQARALMRSYGIPVELVAFNRGSPLVPRHPDAKTFGLGKISIPRIVEVGETLPIQVLAQIDEPLRLYQNLAWRVIRLDTEEVVKRVPVGEMPGVYDSPQIVESGSYVFPNEGPAMWNLTNTDGQPVPPGKYVLQASVGVFIRPPDVMFEVVEKGGNTPLKQLQGPWYEWWY